MYKSILTAAFLLASSNALQAADADTPPPMPDSAPESSDTDQELQPEVTIIQREEGVFEEYRQNGQLYMIKITPSHGFPYYLIDSDGDGSFETRRNELDNPETIQWRLLTW